MGEMTKEEKLEWSSLSEHGRAPTLTAIRSLVFKEAPIGRSDAFLLHIRDALWPWAITHGHEVGSTIELLNTEIQLRLVEANRKIAEVNVSAADLSSKSARRISFLALFVAIILGIMQTGLAVLQYQKD